MPKLSEKEKAILGELEAGALPGVAALNLKMDRRTLNNHLSTMRKKCIEAGKFLKQMRDHQKILKLRIYVKVEEEPRAVV